MPVYPYQYVDARGEPTGETFEVVHPMSAPTLTEHNGRPCARAFPPDAVPGMGGGARSWSKAEGTSLAHRYQVSEELFQNVPSLRGNMTEDGHPISRNDSHDRKWKTEMAAWSEREYGPAREAAKAEKERSRRELRETLKGVIRGRKRHYQSRRKSA